ncbi:TPA: hypothetical protein I7291_09390 [Vibrio parahaemolyticus]|nr:hypothetical protein [Vibrio parahaemolyticus]HAS6915498.1 hypothetical protein [Vibrio parahaemolyticus]HAS6925973.1 hypothetical protein [Vibrio parahaemolyticus]
MLLKFSLYGKSESDSNVIEVPLNNLFRINRFLDRRHKISNAKITFDKVDLNFVDIILRELVNFISEGGCVVLDNVNDGVFKSKSNLAMVLKYYSVISCSNEKVKLLKNKKYTPTKINEWTFGIITNGGREEYIKKIISSIQKQNIPKFEVIICGNVKSSCDLEDDKINFIEFKENDHKGWITRKKNLIVKSSKFENICILHDRYVLDDRWYEGFIEYGGDFDVLSLPQKFQNKWLPYWVENKAELRNAYDVNYIKKDSEWSHDIYLPGGVNVFKSHLIKSTLYNENLFWNEKEDIELSRRQVINGYQIRLNQHSNLTALFSHWRHPTKLGLLIRRFRQRIYKIK